MVGVSEANCGLFVGWVDVGWDEPSTPFTQLRAVLHLAGPRDEQDLRVALSRARQRRKRALRTCGYRGEQLVPGHMASGSCHGCLERHEHVVF